MIIMYKRKTHAKISFDVYRISDDTLASSFEKEFDIDEVVYTTEYEAINLDGKLTEWSDNVAKFKALEVASLEIGSELPDDLDVTTLYGSTFKAENINGHGIETSEYGQTIEKVKEEIRKYEEERQKELVKRQQKKEKADQKRKIKIEKEIEKEKKKPKPEPIIVPVTIDEKPTTLIFKKELTTTDVIQISRAAKRISKLEKQKIDQEKYLNIALGAIERIEESGKAEFLLGQVVTRDRWLDSIKITNTLIERQKEIIEQLKNDIK